MSVIVKGMEMPKNCNECRFAVDGWCYANPKQANGEALNKRVRPNWCPLVPLPEKYGRLIDADALPRYTGYALSADKVATALENAPTIVEAEGDDG